MISCRRALVLALLLVAPANAGAQPAPLDQWAAAKWRFGPLAVTPKIELRNLGWDSNVFAETEDPKSDFTTTVAAPIDWWLRFGRGRLHGVDVFEGVYFATYSSQNGFNQNHDLTLLLPLNRVQPYIAGSYLSTNDRPGYEISARIRHTEAGGRVGAIVRLTSRIDVDISGRQTTYTYTDEAPEETQYAYALDRRTENYGAQARYRLTPLTTLTLLADSVQERYNQDVTRNNDGFRILPGVEFDPYALIQGKAQVGYRKLNTLTPGMPDFSGLVAKAELSYALRGTTRVAVGFSRDIYFSYEIYEPFYIQPGFTLSLTQQVSGPWDVQARGSWYTLNYQSADTQGAATAPGRVDRYQAWGGGIGYRVGRDIRVGFNIDYSRRQSVVQGQDYTGIRGGMAVTYARK